MEFKGIAWAGNIYQKFEAMCLEVEEAMYEVYSSSPNLELQFECLSCNKLPFRGLWNFLVLLVSLSLYRIGNED